MKPLNKFIIIEPEKIDDEQITEAGLIIKCEEDKKVPEKGKVIEIGGKVEEVKKNDIVFFRKYAPQMLKVNGQDIYILSEDDVLMIL